MYIHIYIYIYMCVYVDINTPYVGPKVPKPYIYIYTHTEALYMLKGSKYLLIENFAVGFYYLQYRSRRSR